MNEQNDHSTDLRIREWAVGVTTAPRRSATLHSTLASLAEAGWSGPRLFAEPDCDLQIHRACPVTQRDATLGAFPNWYLAVTELFFRQPRAEAYLICQDDVLLARGMRRWLAEQLWPAPRVGVVSLYCPSHVSRSRPAGWHEIHDGWNSWGALAYLFSNPAIRTLLSDPLLVNHRHHGPAGGARNIDSVVGEWCRQAGLPYFMHVPSLVQHTGETSTIWRRAGNGGRRAASHFVDDVGEIDAVPMKSLTVTTHEAQPENRSPRAKPPLLERHESHP